MSVSQVEVSSTATCKRCGATDVAWVQGKKSGKWYLAEVRKDSSTGALVALRFNFHKCGGGNGTA